MDNRGSLKAVDSLVWKGVFVSDGLWVILSNGNRGSFLFFLLGVGVNHRFDTDFPPEHGHFPHLYMRDSGEVFSQMRKYRK